MSTADAPSDQAEPDQHDPDQAEPDQQDRVDDAPTAEPHDATMIGSAGSAGSAGASAMDALARLEQVGAQQGRRRRKLDVKLLLASMGIAIGLAAVVLGVLSSVTGTEQQNLPDAIESIDPVRNATQVPQQTRVFVDLVTGYEGVLIVDGIELPVVSLDDVSDVIPGLGEDDGEQIDIPPGAIYEPGNATLTFEPGVSQPIESFSTGVHTVTVRYWLTDEGPSRFRTFTWTFYSV